MLYCVIKIVSFILAIFLALIFLMLIGDIDEASLAVFIGIMLLGPAVLLALLGRWAGKKERSINLAKDPLYYEKLEKSKKEKRLEKEKRKAQKIREKELAQIEIDENMDNLSIKINQYLADNDFDIKLDEFKVAYDSLKNLYGFPPSFNDVTWNILNKRNVEHADDFYAIRKNYMSMWKIHHNEGRLSDGACMGLAVCMLDYSVNKQLDPNFVKYISMHGQRVPSFFERAYRFIHPIFRNSPYEKLANDLSLLIYNTEYDNLNPADDPYVLEKTGRVDEAIEIYEKAIANNFDGNHPYDRLAIIYRKRKDYDNEIRVLERGILVFENLKKVSPRGDLAPKIEKFKTRLERAKYLKNKAGAGQK